MMKIHFEIISFDKILFQIRRNATEEFPFLDYLKNHYKKPFS